MTNERRNPNLTKRRHVARAASVTYHSPCPTFLFRSSSFTIYRLIAVAALCAFANSEPISAAVATPRFGVDPPWETEKGLPENSVFSLLQTRDGYLWVGTGYGLARFDGIHFKTFDESDTPGLNSSKIDVLFEDSRENLWIGTETEGVLIVDL